MEIPNYTAPAGKTVGSLGLTSDVNAGHAQIAKLTTATKELYEVPANYLPGFEGGTALDLVAFVYGKVGSSTAPTKAATPTAFAPAGPATSSTASLVWLGPNGATFVLQHSLTSDFSVITPVYTGTTDGATLIGLSPSTVYYARVKAQVAGLADSDWATLQVTTAAAGLPTLVVIDGDSTAFSTGVPDADHDTQSFPARLQAALGSNFEVVCVAIPGTNSEHMLGRAATTVDVLYDTTKYANAVYGLLGGVNDYYQPMNPAATPADTVSRLRQNLQGRKAVGFRSIGGTITATNQPFEADLQTINATLRSDWESWGIDGLCDYRADSALDVPQQPATFADGLHENQLGCQHQARQFYRTLRALCNQLGIAIPQNYLFPFEQPADTVAPTAPGQPVASNITSSGVTLTWAASTDSVGVTGYQVFDANGVSRGSTSTLSKAVTGLSPATAYTLTVKAYDAAGNVSAASPSVNVTTSAGTVTPGLVDVSFIEVYNGATITGNTISGPGYSGAYSQQLIGPSSAAVRGIVSVEMGQEPINCVIGVNTAANSHGSNGYSDINGVQLFTGNWRALGPLLVPEAGFSSASPGDVYDIYIESGGFRFFKNTEEDSFYAADVPAEALQIDMFFLGQTTLHNVRIFAANPLTA